jgi:hypothetical protein
MGNSNRACAPGNNCVNCQRLLMILIECNENDCARRWHIGLGEAFHRLFEYGYEHIAAADERDTHTKSSLPPTNRCLANIQRPFTTFGLAPLEMALNNSKCTYHAIGILLAHGARVTGTRTMSIVKNRFQQTREPSEISMIMCTLIRSGQVTVSDALNEWGYKWLAHPGDPGWFSLLQYGLDPYHIVVDEEPPSPTTHETIPNYIWMMSLSWASNRVQPLRDYQQQLMHHIGHAMNGTIAHELIDTIIVGYYLCPLPSLEHIAIVQQMHLAEGETFSTE